MSPWFLSAVLGATVLVVCGLAYLVTVGFRTRNRATCWSCGAAKVRPSHTHVGLDMLAMLFFLKPYRCAGCRTRFYGFRSFHGASSPVAPPPAVALVPDPSPSRIRIRVIVRLPLVNAWMRAWEEVSVARNLGHQEGFKAPSELLR